jgi:two-component system capsular synthesis sensor histidine kinase RcsC
MAEAIIAVDEHINIIIFNSAALNILDVNNIEEGDALHKFLRPINSESQLVDVASLIRQSNEPIVNRDLRLAYSDGSLINLYLSITPVYIGYGEKGQPGFVLLLRDITREKSLEEERDEFISVVSHELRAPVTVAEGNLSNAIFLSDKSEVPDNVIMTLNSAHNQILNLAEMINDLSTLSRAERKDLQLDINNIQVKEMISSIIQDYLPQASKKSLSLASEIDPSVDILVSSELYVREILQNFITNSLKYTESGQILIKVYRQADGVAFEVSDTGIGISKADQEQVFDKFFRSSDERASQATGTGLGLYITMKLVHLIKAKVSLVSELNNGSTFSVYVPNLRPVNKSS